MPATRRAAYSEARVMPAQARCAELPDAIDFDTGAAMMLKGLTAQYLLKKTLPVEGLQTGDSRAVPCRRRRRRPDRLPVGQGAGPAADRHRRQRRQVPAGAGAWRGACHQLRQGRLRRPRQGDHRRQGRQGGLRLGGQGHLGRQPELPAPLRPDGQLRQCVGPGAAVCAGHPRGQGFAVRDPRRRCSPTSPRASPRRRWPTTCSAWSAAAR